MKRQLFCAIIALVGLCMATPATAQITIDKVETKEETISFRDTMKRSDTSTEYFSLARYKAERAAIRKERNTLELTTGVMATLTQYNDPWVDVSGGDNSIATTANVFFQHVFTKDRFSIETKFEGKFGYNRMKVETRSVDENGQEVIDREGIWFKNQDEFYLYIAPSWKMAKNWAYGGSVKFRSQLAKGYVSRTEQEHKDLKSTFMTPGYLDLSVGVKFHSPFEKWPFKVELSPIALSATYATNDWIRCEQYDEEGNRIKKAYAYGIEDPDKSAKYEGGSSIQIDYDRTFGPTKYLRYRTTLYSFWGWITNAALDNRINNYGDYRDALREWEANNGNIKDKPHAQIHPTVRWENTIEIKATKLLTTTINFQLYYNRAQSTHIQTKTFLSVGVAYTFKNK